MTVFESIVKEGDVIENCGNLFIVQNIDYAIREVRLIREKAKSPLSFNPSFEWMENTFQNGHSKFIYKDVRNTKLARKIYPNAEVLDNGMLRIRR